MKSSPRTMIICAFVLADDLATNELRIVNSLGAFISGRSWLSGPASVVNNQFIASDGEPQWDIGMSLLVEGSTPESIWLSELEDICYASQSICRELGVVVVLAVADSEGANAEDVEEITADSLDLESIKRFFVGAPK